MDLCKGTCIALRSLAPLTSLCRAVKAVVTKLVPPNPCGGQGYYLDPRTKVREKNKKTYWDVRCTQISCEGLDEECIS